MNRNVISFLCVLQYVTMAVWAGVLYFASLSYVAGDCTPGKYGYRCSYQCYCPLVNCNSTSGCEPANCSDGWSGPTCQKENLAFNMTTSSSSVHFPSSNAVNGDIKGGDEHRCFHSVYDDANITSAWWRVDLGNETLVRDVVIYFRTNYIVRRNGIQIYIADTDNSSTDGVNCYNVTGNRNGTDIPDVLNVTCSDEGRFLVLYTTTVNNEINNVNVPVLDFCEVKVEVCGPGTFGADCNNYCHCDGEVCNYLSGVCPSGDCLPGWQPDKCDTVCVFGGYGRNCNGRCPDRHCKGDNSSCAHVTGKCVEGCEAGWNGTDCTQKCVNSYGEGCVHLCSSRRCSGTSSCNHVTGHCENGCRHGWKHIDCTEACIQGVEHGAGCVSNCSARMCKGGNFTCPRDTGQCVSGCHSGWKGGDCATACVQGLEYGANCVGNCSARMCGGEIATCPWDTGRCESGCQSGWKGGDCITVCSSGTYGANCTGKCGQCRDSKNCHHVNGACPSGCIDGWTEHTCTQTISMPVPSNAGAIAGAILAVLAVLAIIVVVVVVFRRRKSHPKRSDDHTDMFEIHKGHISDKGLENSAHKGVVEEDEDGVEEDQNMEDHSATYYNIASAPAVTVVSVDQLGERIKELQVPVGRFQAEFQKLSTTFTRPYKNSQLEENKGKNKYISYYPYDATRVVLKEVPDQPGSDYINASYIDGHSQPKAYIAAQAPNKKTLTDFWKMIWEQNCTQIVMLTNLKELGRVKCEAYWSDTSDMRVGDFIISVTDSKRRANWVVRELQVTETKTNTSRCFDHFHFTTWPDHGTPEETALTEFLWLVRTAPTIQHEALLVHCSAGVGRTGTYIAVDYLLDQALAEDRVDVFGCVSRMRDQRKGMIQTKEQYTCVYMALYETLEFGNTAISVEDFRYRRNMRGAFSMGRMAVSKLIETLNTERKEQSQEPSVRGRVWINGCSDILAVSSRSHLSVKGYLLTEAPSVTTASLFWKLTEEQESSTVIVLPDSHQSLSSFVPSTGDSLDLGPVNVRCSRETTVNTDITLLNIHRQMENSPTALVHVYVLNILPAESPSTLLELLEQVDRHTGEVNPHTVTVIYSDGGRQNGAMLCILSNIVQGLKHDKRAEIYNNMRTMTHCLDQDITQDDIALCYDVATAYLESQNIYANM
ncbi:receptor-type tyrosine-protein phosphatase alpha-like isoform X11 [Haliotis rufescens]|uniref:receptor-type tyrosine-protein phosphatase alpha-like isoform X11 n=1 Tax=Haliotis rufescens TaxID=6454 RepID=UPI00201F49AE|nr:receptor-type tyrosine-protein phosphatase alpha-like isoform X11 [Haliotis rufescens]